MGNNTKRVKSHKEVDSYITSLHDGSPESKAEARKALIRTGVLNKNGKAKKQIVTSE